MSSRTIIHSARLVSDGLETDDAWVLLGGGDDGSVEGRGTGDGWLTHAEDGRSDVVDAAGRFLVPGFIDLHVHGGGGASVDDGADAMRRVLATHRLHGTTRSAISLVSAPLDELASRLSAIADLASTDPTILGAHLEGPFLSQDNRGAHDPAALIPPTPEAVALLLEAARGHLLQITIAPELPGVLEAIRTLRAAGVIVAVGHTTGDADVARAAFSAGATLLTHAFNAMPGIHHRHPGPIPVAIGNDDVVLELIADGVHVSPPVLALAFTAAPGHIALVTDAMAAADAPDGDYELGGLAVTVHEGVARLTGTDVIAGSTLTQDGALRTVLAAGVPMIEAVRALTETPARVVGRSPELGSLAVGSAGDAVLLADDLTVDAVWVAGERES